MSLPFKEIEYELNGEKKVIRIQKASLYQSLMHKNNIDRLFDEAFSNDETLSEKISPDNPIFSFSVMFTAMRDCTTGDVPELDETLHKIDPDFTDRWLEIAQELNPTWFLIAGENDGVSEADNKKK